MNVAFDLARLFVAAVGRQPAASVPDVSSSHSHLHEAERPLLRLVR